MADGVLCADNLLTGHDRNIAYLPGHPRTLRILCVTGIYSPDIGGPATYLPQLCDALVARGHTITVVTLSDLSGNETNSSPYRVVRVSRRSWLLWRWMQTLRALLREGWGVDVLFVHGLALEAALANLVLRKPLVHKVVGDLAWERATIAGLTRDSFEAFQGTRYGPRIEAFKAFRAWWTCRAVEVIVASAYMARWVAHWGVPAERLAIIPNAIEPRQAPPRAHVPLAGMTRVISAGRLVPWKHVDDIVRAVAHLNGVGLVVIGDGPARGGLEALAADLAVTDRVFFAGQRSWAETMSIMAACDIFVMNSSWESYSFVVLEAMSLGLAVIATEVDGVSERVQNGETGLLISPGDVPGLRQALERLVRSPRERLEMGRRGKQSAGRFPFSSMMDQTEAVLRSSAGMRDG